MNAARVLTTSIIMVSMWLCPMAAESPSTDTTSAIRAQIDAYIDSINRADTDAGARVWSTTPEVTFVHPRGTEHGWDQVKKNFYENTMGAMFSSRTLKIVGDAGVQVYGTTAVALFNWDFVATLRNGGDAVHTQGRETQVYVNQNGAGWRLVHVHYSGPPVTGQRQGF